MPGEISQTGYVSEIKLELIETPAEHDQRIYCTVIITDDETGNVGAKDWFLYRNIGDSVDKRASGDYWAISFGSLNQAVIAVLKDALLRRNKVEVKGVEYSPTGDPAGPWENRLQSVSIRK